MGDYADQAAEVAAEADRASRNIDDMMLGRRLRALAADLGVEPGALVDALSRYRVPLDKNGTPVFPGTVLSYEDTCAVAIGHVGKAHVHTSDGRVVPISECTACLAPAAPKPTWTAGEAKKIKPGDVPQVVKDSLAAAVDAYSDGGEPPLPAAPEPDCKHENREWLPQQFQRCRDCSRIFSPGTAAQVDQKDWRIPPAPAPAPGNIRINELTQRVRPAPPPHARMVPKEPECRHVAAQRDARKEKK